MTEDAAPTGPPDEPPPAGYPLETPPEPTGNPPASYPLGSDDAAKAPTGLPDGGTSDLLLRLLRLRPFTSLYRDTTDRHRPVREFACFWADAALILVVYVLLLGLVATVAIKVLSPLPDLWPF